MFKGILILPAALALSAAEVLSPCSAAVAPLSKDGQEVIITGALIFGYHSAYLTELGSEVRKQTCAIFTAFPGTPAFLTPGFSVEHEENVKLQSFAIEYKRYMDQNPTVPKTIRIHGILKIACQSCPGSKAKGFGQRGTFRTAIIVSEASAIATVRQRRTGLPDRTGSQIPRK